MKVLVIPKKIVKNFEILYDRLLCVSKTHGMVYEIFVAYLTNCISNSISNYALF